MKTCMVGYKLLYKLFSLQLYKSHCIRSESFRAKLASIKLSSESIARQASRSFLYGDIKLAMHINPESANSFATSPI